MPELILSIAAAFFAIKWLSCWVGNAALVKYMLDKGYTPPSDEEMKACCMYAWEKVLHIK